MSVKHGHTYAPMTPPQAAAWERMADDRGLRRRMVSPGPGTSVWAHGQREGINATVVLEVFRISESGCVLETQDVPLDYS